MSTEEKGHLRIMILDEAAEDTQTLAKSLSRLYQVHCVPGGTIGLQEAILQQPDLLLINAGPLHDGIHTSVRSILRNPSLSDTPLMVLADTDAETAQQASLVWGTDDCLARPIPEKQLIARIQKRLTAKQRDVDSMECRFLFEQELIRKNREVLRTQEFFIAALASIAETRDNETGLHIERTRLYLSVLARELKANGPREYRLSEADIRLIVRSAPLHDIGKIGIPDHILMKNGALSTQEFDIIKTHSMIGVHALERAERLIGYSQGFLRHAKDIVRTHHEWWNGCGYPEGLKEREIPLSGRLMAVADVYDALISNRVYKSAMTHEMAVNIIRSERGTHFDPVIVDAFLAKRDRFARIADRMICNERKSELIDALMA